MNETGCIASIARPFTPVKNGLVIEAIPYDLEQQTEYWRVQVHLRRSLVVRKGRKYEGQIAGVRCLEGKGIPYVIASIG